MSDGRTLGSANTSPTTFPTSLSVLTWPLRDSSVSPSATPRERPIREPAPCQLRSRTQQDRDSCQGRRHEGLALCRDKEVATVKDQATVGLLLGGGRAVL